MATARRRKQVACAADAPGEPFNASIIAEIDTAFAPLASDRPEDLGSAVTACRPYNCLRLKRRSGEPSPVFELAPWERVLSE